MHYYKRNLGDYAKKAGRLSMLQHGSYTLLIDACYDREQFPTMEEAIDWTWASSTAEIEAVEFVLRKFFVLEDGRFVQKRIQEEIADYQAKSETNARIAAEREANRKANSTKRARSVDDALQKNHEPPPNQEPITINQEPIVIGESAIASQPPKPRPSRKCPFEFVVTDSLAVWAVENTPLVDIVAATAAFRDHTFKTAMTDWAGAWRNWMRRDQQYAAEKQKPPAAETVYQRSMRARVEEAAPSIARRAPTISQPDAADFFRTIATPGHVVDVKAIEVQP
jgi:uncharacterized protein YdaU (DUF1376 family)